VAAPDARRTQVLHRLDPRTGRLSDKPLLAVAGFELVPEFVANEEWVLGIRLQGDGEVTRLRDEGMKALQAEVDRRLPGAVNRIRPPRRAAGLGCAGSARAAHDKPANRIDFWTRVEKFLVRSIPPR
jgi:hypothetical protein